MVGLGALAGGVHRAARRHVARIEATPDPYTLGELLREPEGREVTVERPDGTRLRALVDGEEGPTLVFVHGYGATLVEWNVIWRRLRGRYRLIAFDGRGHGRSTVGAGGVSSRAMAADLAAVLDHFDVRGGTLIGHSMGGFVSVRCLLDHPGVTRARLARAIIVASFAGDVTRGAPQPRLHIPLIASGVMPALCRTRTYGWLFMGAQFGRVRFASGVEALRRVFVAQDHGRLIPILRALQRENDYPRLSEISLPCTVICGDADDTTPRHHSETLARDIPGARFVGVPGCGHILNWEAPEVITQAIEGG